jgi:hypothetical protein
MRSAKKALYCGADRRGSPNVAVAPTDALGAVRPLFSSRIVTLPSNHLLRRQIRNSLGSSPPLTSRARYQQRKPQRDSDAEGKKRHLPPQFRQLPNQAVVRS